MNNFEDFQPQNEEEAHWIHYYNNLSSEISGKIRNLNEKDRFTVLKEINPSDLSLMNLYLMALKNEDYETCEAAKTLLLERGFKIPG